MGDKSNQKKPPRNPTISVGDICIYHGKAVQVIGVVAYWTIDGNKRNGYFVGNKRGERWLVRSEGALAKISEVVTGVEERVRGSQPGAVVSPEDRQV